MRYATTADDASYTVGANFFRIALEQSDVHQSIVPAPRMTVNFAGTNIQQQKSSVQTQYSG